MVGCRLPAFYELSARGCNPSRGPPRSGDAGWKAPPGRGAGWLDGDAGPGRTIRRRPATATVSPLWYDHESAPRAVIMGIRRDRGAAGRFLAAAWKVVATAAAFVIVLLASAYFTMRLVQIGARVTVPDLTGMTLDEAGEALTPLSLMAEVAAEHHDERLEQGRILAQEPPAGGPIKKFRKVKVVASLGPRVFTIPELRGQLLSSALIALEAEGLRPGRIAYAYTPLADAGVVVAQDPPPEGESLGHAGVSLLVGKGVRDPLFVMPSFKGVRLGLVSETLERHGLRLGSVRRELAPWAPSGQVTGQYPEAGYPVSRRDTITLVVSN